MDWTAVAAVLSVVGTIGLGLLTLLRGTKSDKALNIATNVQNTFTAQQALVDQLQEEVDRHKADLKEYRTRANECEAECRKSQSNLAGARMIIAAQEVEIERLKSRVNEHGRVIDQISRREDHEPPREDDAERRHHD